jgi:non-homologous end joining protein Ku
MARSKFILRVGLVPIPLKKISSNENYSSYFCEVSEKGEALGRAKTIKNTGKIYEGEVFKKHKLTNTVLTSEEIKTINSNIESELYVLGIIQTSFKRESEAIVSKDDFFFVPDLKTDKTSKAYTLLWEELRKGYEIIVKICVSTREKLVRINALSDGRLYAEFLRYANDLKKMGGVELPSVSSKESELFSGLFKKVGEELNYDYEFVEDNYLERLNELISRKNKGETINVTQPVKQSKDELLELLKASV